MPNAYHGWNIFARELDAVLRAHQSWIGQLDNNAVALHPQLVQRLQASLDNPKPLVLLNPEDLERLIKIFAMSTPEQHRLKAAVLATAVERVLMDRIEAPLALMVANNAFDTLLAALNANPSMANTIRDSLFLSSIASTAQDAFTRALDYYDQALLDLYLAIHTDSDNQPQAASFAIQSFIHVLVTFAECPSEVTQTKEWQYWQQEAERGRLQAQKLLEGDK